MQKLGIFYLIFPFPICPLSTVFCGHIKVLKFKLRSFWNNNEKGFPDINGSNVNFPLHPKKAGLIGRNSVLY